MVACFDFSVAFMFPFFSVFFTCLIELGVNRKSYAIFSFVEKLWERFHPAHDFICFNMNMSRDRRMCLAHGKCERRWVWVYAMTSCNGRRYLVRDSLLLRDTCCVSSLSECFPLPTCTDAVGIAWLGSKKFVRLDQLCHVDQLAR